MNTDVDLSKATPRPWVNDAPGCIGKHYDQGGKKTVLMAPQEDAEGIANAALANIAVNEYDDALALIRRLKDALAAMDASACRGFETRDDRIAGRQALIEARSSVAAANTYLGDHQ